MIKLEQLKKMLDNSQLKKPMLIGKRGEGKTEKVKELARHYKLSLFILNISAIEAQDFCGLPFIKDGISHYARPHFFDYDILFFDEIDRVQDQSIKAALLSLFNDKKINGHEYKGFIICAGNGTEHGQNETSDFDDALNDRIVKVPFAYSTSEKISYLEKKHGIENTLLKYFTAKEAIFDELSTRSVDYSLQFSSDLELLKYCLPSELLRHYEMFLNNLVLTLDDLINLKPFEKLSSMTKISLANDISNNLQKISGLPVESIEHLNRFVNSLAAEEKTNYYLKLQNLALNDKTFKATAKKLNDSGFFKDQKDFLKELNK